MKKLLLFIVLIGFSCIMSCTEKPDPEYIDMTDPSSPNKPNNTNKNCWEFTTKVKTSIKGVSIPGYPKTVTATTKECDLTEAQAEEIVKRITTTASSSVQGVTATIETTCTKRKL